jgi:7-cyano-7-deazaguanine synthase
MKRNKYGDSSVCVLVSGGVESAAMIAKALQDGLVVYPVYVRGGHAWEKIELYWLKRLLRALRGQRLKPLSILELPVHDCYRQAQWSLSGRRVPSARTKDERVYLPGRNILLLAKASVFCAERGIRCIVLGTLGSNPFPDANASFFRRMAGALSSGLGVPIRVKMPFGRLHKEQVLTRAGQVPWQFTFSCIAPAGLRHCGRCNKCAERKKAFRAARVSDPTVYRA